MYNKTMIPVAILGATGTVGQKFITLLQNHPQFRIQELVASQRSAGSWYKDAVSWQQSVPLPAELAETMVLSTEDELSSPILFSGLDSSVAYEVEKNYAERGHVVISNAKNHRMEARVPLVIPEINHEHLRAIEAQDYKGAIITNPNCCVMQLALALAPLHRAFGIKQVMVQTMQAISGAGYPGVASLDILGNVVPFISGEEEKLESEPRKILGGYDTAQGFVEARIEISAHCNRVAVVDGHTECVSLSLEKQPKTMEELITTWNDFSAFPQEHGLHSAPQAPLLFVEGQERPQPRLDLWTGKGMTTTIGRLRRCPILEYKFVVLGHNTIRGAAGAAVLNAEAALAMNLLERYL